MKEDTNTIIGLISGVIIFAIVAVIFAGALIENSRPGLVPPEIDRPDVIASYYGEGTYKTLSLSPCMGLPDATECFQDIIGTATAETTAIYVPNAAYFLGKPIKIGDENKR
jgi:hypothetical protein